MNLFERILRDILLAGTYTLPVFIHSQHGIAILNASQEGLIAILQASAPQQASVTTPLPHLEEPASPGVSAL